jgi:hypothetical protein
MQVIDASFDGAVGTARAESVGLVVFGAAAFLNCMAMSLASDL